ncbi:sigma-70 family RNA polymerase sigma factor [Aquimarina sp. D1M17]|uniref:RNA polymerase sigma factor n=1 Tax=Aquimarina acroporae TaxID=2937283 RepID=UPI0020BEB7EC|nr:sigma-70 family RNA polymerase sigma factor [Aquimarina acroporae]MCK8521357.1 sigma-70 family RNA polymerase sigma factor [Aquimarina acroporae]
MNKSKDVILLEELKRGSDDAFKKVYQDNRTKFLSFAKKYGLESQDILDIYQDSYITLYENIVSGKLIELSSTLSTYLISIGKYKILERLRKNKHKVNDESIFNFYNENDASIEAFDLEFEKLTTKEELLAMYFDQLGEKCKAILIMFYYKKYSIKEIMSFGNYNSENVVKSQKSRCLKTLKQLFHSTPKQNE